MALSFAEDVDKGFTVEAQRHRLPKIETVEGWLVVVQEQVPIDPTIWRQFADCLRHLTLHVPEERNREGVRKGHVELSGNESQCRGRPIADDRIFDAVEIRPVGLPVIRVSRHPDVFVGFELAEFERAGAYRMLAHLAWRHMAGVDL